MRIGFIGAARFDSAALDKFPWNLKAKYPNAVIVTGDGKGAEAHTYESAQMLGFKVKRPELTKLIDPDSAMLLQVGQIVAESDIIVLVAGGARPKLAKDIWNRINLHEKDKRGGLVKKNGKPVSHRTTPIQLFEIAPAIRKTKELVAA